VNKDTTFDNYNLFRAVVRIDDRQQVYPIRTAGTIDAAYRLAIRAGQRQYPRAERISVLRLEPDRPAPGTTLPDRIRSLRYRLGESRTVFGARFGARPRTIERWEQGGQAPRARSLERLAQLEAWAASREGPNP
jgi:DNA-binding transcriptional regulator YiaG